MVCRVDGEDQGDAVAVRRLELHWPTSDTRQVFEDVPLGTLQLVVEGADAQRYLHSQVSQAILDQAVGEQRWTFVLEPTGKIDALARITRTADDRFEVFPRQTKHSGIA